jgi:hypothetical protein
MATVHVKMATAALRRRLLYQVGTAQTSTTAENITSSKQTAPAASLLYLGEVSTAYSAIFVAWCA